MSVCKLMWLPNTHDACDLWDRSAKLRMRLGRGQFILWYTSHVLCKHSNGEEASPANLKLTIGA